MISHLHDMYTGECAIDGRIKEKVGSCCMVQPTSTDRFIVVIIDLIGN